MRSNISSFSTSFGTWIGALALLFAPLMVQAATPSTNTGNDSTEAARLLRAVRADAVQVHKASVELDKLTKTSGATWLEYDRQWNEIKSSVEDMQIKLWRLERMRSSLPASDQKQADQAKAADPADPDENACASRVAGSAGSATEQRQIPGRRDGPAE